MDAQVTQVMGRPITVQVMGSSYQDMSIGSIGIVDFVALVILARCKGLNLKTCHGCLNLQDALSIITISPSVNRVFMHV